MSGEFVPELKTGQCGTMTGRWKLRGKIIFVIRATTALLLATVSQADGGNGFGKSEGSERISFSIEENAGRLLDVHGDSILRLAYSYLHNMQDAEDILQETLIRYMRAKPEFENDMHARAWLLKVAANLSKNRIEYNRYRMTDELNEELVAEEREDLSFVWEAVKSLPVPYRETIHLFYQEGYKTAQIAEILGEKEPTVRSRLKRGREKLRDILKEVYDFAE